MASSMVPLEISCIRRVYWAVAMAEFVRILSSDSSCVFWVTMKTMTAAEMISGMTMAINDKPSSFFRIVSFKVAPQNGFSIKCS